MLFLSTFLLISLFYLFFYEKHYLMIMLFIEMILFFLYVYFSVYFVTNIGLAGMFMFLVIIVCMGAFGISLLVNISRQTSLDFWKQCFIF